MEISYDQFPGVAIEVSSISAEYSDPFELLANAEEELVEAYLLNFQGNIMTTTVAQALTDAGVTSKTFTRHLYLDLLDVLQEKLLHPSLKARVLSSMAWMIDTTIINQARTIYYQMFQDAQLNGIDSYNDFMAKFDEAMQTFDNQDTNALTLRKLLTLRNEWHDAAEASASEARTRYIPRSFEEILAAEKPQRVDAMTRANLELLAKAISPNNREATIELLTKRQQALNESRHESRKEIIPFIITIIGEASRNLPDTVSFHQLSINTQERLVDQAAKTVERALEDLATDRKLTTVEYAGIIQEALVAAKELREISRTCFNDRDVADAQAAANA